MVGVVDRAVGTHNAVGGLAGRLHAWEWRSGKRKAKRIQGICSKIYMSEMTEQITTEVQNERDCPTEIGAILGCRFSRLSIRHRLRHKI
jgi:hypothetical protein